MTSKLVAIAMLSTTATISIASPVAAVPEPTISGDTDDQSDPLGFLDPDGNAPNTQPYCDSPTYFDQWNDIDQNFDVGPWTIDTGTGINGGEVVATATKTGGLINHVHVPAFGLILASGGAIEVSLSEPLFYSQWLLVDHDALNEGVNFTAEFNGGPVDGVGAYGANPLHTSTVTQPDTATLIHTGDNTMPAYIGTNRGQVDVFGGVDTVYIDKFGSGASGFMPAGGCEALGSSKELTQEPIWDPVTETWTAIYTIRVKSNLPTQENLESAMTAAAAANAVSDIPAIGTISEIQIEDLEISDNLVVPGLNVDSVTTSTSTGLPLNTAYDGDGDINLVAAGFDLPPEELHDVIVEVVYSPDLTAPAMADGCATFENQATAVGIASSVGVSDETDNGSMPFPQDVNEAGTGVDDPTPVEMCVDPAVETTKAVTSSELLADDTIDVEYAITIENTGDLALPATLTDDLDAVFGAGSVYTNIAIVADGVCAGFENSSGFDGSADTDLLTANAVVLPVGELCNVSLSFNVDPIPPPAVDPGTTYSNTVVAALDAGAIEVEDDAVAAFDEILPSPEITDDESLDNVPGTAVDVPLLGNDDADIDPASIAFIDPATGLPLASGADLVVPDEGTWSVDPATGIATFTPESGFVGDPTPIDYAANDTEGNPVLEPATITVTYLPEITDDESLDNAPGTQVAVPLLGNDADDIDPASIAFIDPATGLPLNPGQNLVVPGEGTWMVNQTTGVAFFTPEPGFTGNPTPVDYTANDFDGNEAVEPATIGVTYLPEAADDESLGNPEGEEIRVDVLGNDSANLDPSTVAIDDPNYDPSTGTLVVDGEGTWTVDPVTGAITFEPEPGFQGDPTPISYTVEDESGNQVVGDVVVTYAPTLEPDEDLGNIAGAAVTIDVLGNDPSTDIDPASVMILDADGNPVTSLEVPGEGTWTVDPATGAITFTPAPGFPGGPTPIEYTASDTDGNVAEPVTVTVGYLPVEPVPSDENLDNPPGMPVVVDILANDGNVDPTSVQLIAPATGEPISGDLVVPGEGTWTVDPATGALTFTPEPGFQGDPTPVTYTVKNENGITVGAEAVVTYLPVAEDDESLNNSAGSTVTVDVLGNDPTLDLDPTTVAIDDPNFDPSTGTLVVDGEGTWTVDPVTGAISFEAESGFLGDPTPISYTVEDADGNEVSAAVVITYVAPEVVADDELLGNESGSTVTIDVVGNDGDVDPTSVQVLDPATGLPVAELVVAGEGTWTVDPVTGALTFVPEAGFEGDPTPVDYVVTSVAGETLTATATITYVDPVAPVLALTGVESWQLTMAALLAVGAGMALTLAARREEDEVTM